jgi:trehalose-phosphatase
MLDYDGTLAPFTVERDQAFVYPGILPLLEQINDRHDTRLVIVTGRSIADIKPLLKLRQIPEIWGSHGWEVYHPDAAVTVGDAGPATIGLRLAAEHATELGFADRLEYKPVSIAIHWRGIPQKRKSSILAVISPVWEMLAMANGLQVHPFDGGIELRIPGRDKGTAVRDILSSESDDIFSIYMGDDLSDEDAFKAIHTVGFGVLVRSTLRKTNAHFWTHPPQGILSLLQELAR